MSEETGWLIEHPYDPRYGRESWYAGKDGFTLDSLKAIRFARQEDAEREIDRLPISLAKSLRATDHAWCGPTPGVAEMYPMPAEAPPRPRCQACDAKQAEIHRQTKRAEEFLSLLHDRDAAYARERDRLLSERDPQDQVDHAIKVNRREADQAGYDRALRDIGYTVSVGMIAAERRRQVEGESWTSMHDDGHDAGQLALAAACYAIESAGKTSVNATPLFGLEVSVDIAKLYWPFSDTWFKPATPLRNLVKAGALIAAEIDRRLRAGEEP